MKILIAVPLPEHVSNTFYSNLLEIINYTRHNLKDLEDLQYQTATGVRTDKNRNKLIDMAMNAGMDYILWLDADMVYPVDIIVKYFEQAPFDIIGCCYFKRKPPYDPVLYINGDNPLKPYKVIDPTSLPQNTIIEVDGIGFGGVMVNCNVYKTMGLDCYMNYGLNFHLPYETTDQITHDLVWCKKAKTYGFKVYVHTGVYAGHLIEKVVTVEDFKQFRTVRDNPKENATNPKVAILIPTVNPEKAKQVADICHQRAGYPHKIIVEEDVDRIGWVAMINKLHRENPADFYIYGADDMFPSRNFLKEAMEVMENTEIGLLAFNDAKWNGINATFGIVRQDWIKTIYDTDLLHKGYRSHYADPELTMIARGQNKYAYKPEISMVEIVYNKEGTNIPRNNEEDRKLFRERKKSGFNGLVKGQEILDSLN